MDNRNSLVMQRVGGLVFIAVDIFDIGNAFGTPMHRATSHLSKPILSALLRAKMAHIQLCPSLSLR